MTSDSPSIPTAASTRASISGPKTTVPTGASGTPTVEAANFCSDPSDPSTETWLISARSWSVVAIQNTGTLSLPALVASFASLTVVSALKRENNGPPNNPTCCPVTNRRGPAPQTSDIFQGLGRRTPCFVLPFQNARDLLPADRVITDRRCLVLQPLNYVWRTGVERLYGGCPGKEISEKRCGMRDLPEWQTLRFHRQLP